MSDRCSIRASGAVTRFLQPFRFHPGRFGRVTEALESLAWQGEPIWRCTSLSGAYTTEYLADFLNLGVQDATRWRYLRVRNHDSARWLAQTDVWYPGAPTNPEHASGPERAILSQSETAGGIEVFLHHLGVGVLSIALAPQALDQDASIDLDSIKAFNYRLAQHGPDRAALMKRRRTDLPNERSVPTSEDQASGRKLSPFLPDFAQRAASGDQWFPLQTLCRFLLRPLDPPAEKRDAESLGFSFLHAQALLLPYTVVRFPDGTSFSSLERPENVAKADDLAAQASVLAQLDEASHPLPVSEDHGALVRVFHTDELSWPHPRKAWRFCSATWARRTICRS